MSNIGSEVVGYFWAWFREQGGAERFQREIALDRV